MSNVHPVVREVPPTALNVSITLVAVGLYITSLFWASHATTIGFKALSIVVFASVGNTLFSMMHESVHGVLSRNYWWGDLFFAPRNIGYHTLYHIHPRAGLHSLPKLRAWYLNQKLNALYKL